MTVFARIAACAVCIVMSQRCTMFAQAERDNQLRGVAGHIKQYLLREDEDTVAIGKLDSPERESLIRELD